MDAVVLETDVLGSGSQSRYDDGLTGYSADRAVQADLQPGQGLQFSGLQITVRRTPSCLLSLSLSLSD